MQIIINNNRQLEIAINDMYNKLGEFGSLNLTYDKPFRDKSLNQLGYIFGCIMSCVKDYFHNLGDEKTIEEIKENFYSATSYLDERLRKNLTRFNGEKYSVPLRLSEMDIEQASLFIDRCIYLIDESPIFKDMILPPSARYTWVRHITDDDIRQIQGINLPRLDKDYLEYQRKQACMICGVQNKTEAHHLKEAGDSGTGYKSDDWETMPLCFNCHRLYHQQGKSYLENNIKYITKYIDVADFCKMNYLRWKNHI